MAFWAALGASAVSAGASYLSGKGAQKSAEDAQARADKNAAEEREQDWNRFLISTGHLEGPSGSRSAILPGYAGSAEEDILGHVMDLFRGQTGTYNAQDVINQAGLQDAYAQAVQTGSIDNRAAMEQVLREVSDPRIRNGVRWALDQGTSIEQIFSAPQIDPTPGKAVGGSDVVTAAELQALRPRFDQAVAEGAGSDLTAENFLDQYIAQNPDSQAAQITREIQQQAEIDQLPAETEAAMREAFTSGNQFIGDLASGQVGAQRSQLIEDSIDARDSLIEDVNAQQLAGVRQVGDTRRAGANEINQAVNVGAGSVSQALIDQGILASSTADSEANAIRGVGQAGVERAEAINQAEALAIEQALQQVLAQQKAQQAAAGLRGSSAFQDNLTLGNTLGARLQAALNSSTRTGDAQVADAQYGAQATARTGEGQRAQGQFNTQGAQIMAQAGVDTAGRTAEANLVSEQELADALNEVFQRRLASDALASDQRLAGFDANTGLQLQSLDMPTLRTGQAYDFSNARKDSEFGDVNRALQSLGFFRIGTQTPPSYETAPVSVIPNDTQIISNALSSGVNAFTSLGGADGLFKPKDTGAGSDYDLNRRKDGSGYSF